jgi:hypothetical protein
MAMAGASKGPASDSIMEASKIKPLLALSKREPVQAAIGLTADGEGLLLLDKKAGPRKVLALLRAAAAKAKIALNTSSLRFGRAEVDPDYDSSMVRLFINKDAPGVMRVRLVEVVKRAAYQKVELNVDAALDDLPEDDEPAETTPAAADAGTLRQTLAGLVERLAALAGGSTALRAQGLKLAAAANDQLKSGDLAAAESTIAALRTALDTPSPPPGEAAQEAAAVSAGAVAYAKCRLIWLGSRKKVNSEIERLTQALAEAYRDEGIGDAVATLFRQRVAPVLDTFDESLADTLDDAINQTDPERRRAVVQSARAIIDSYQRYLASEPLVGRLDANPLIGLSIQATMSTALQALSAAVR